MKGSTLIRFYSEVRMLVADLGPRDAADLLVSFRSEMNALWNIFIIVVLGLVGLASGKKTPAARPLKLAIVLAFLIFAAGNLYGLLADEDYILALLAPLGTESFSGPLASTFSHLQASPGWRVATYHILLDALVVSALWSRQNPRANAAHDLPALSVSSRGDR